MGAPNNTIAGGGLPNQTQLTWHHDNNLTQVNINGAIRYFSTMRLIRTGAHTKNNHAGSPKLAVLAGIWH